MTRLTQLRDRYLNTSVEATAHYTKVWGKCSHCDTHTPWMARPARGYYKCLECGQHLLDAEAAHPEGSSENVHRLQRESSASSASHPSA